MKTTNCNQKAKDQICNQKTEIKICNQKTDDKICDQKTDDKICNQQTEDKICDQKTEDKICKTEEKCTSVENVWSHCCVLMEVGTDVVKRTDDEGEIDLTDDTSCNCHL